MTLKIKSGEMDGCDGVRTCDPCRVEVLRSVDIVASFSRSPSATQGGTMKYIRRRKDKSNINHFDVQIRLAGERPIYNSFFSKIAAEKFVRQTLVAFDEGKLNHHKDKKTFLELAHIYLMK